MKNYSENFTTISKIDCGNKETWSGKIFLTFDIDWAHDEVLEDTINLITKAGVDATWFVTHPTKLLRKLRTDLDHELGIHPNFNDLLSGTNQSSSKEIIKDYLRIVPDAKSVRSHSLTQSERLVDQFHECGLTHISNFFIPYGNLSPIAPFQLWDEMAIIPHCWQDNVALRISSCFPNTVKDVAGLHVVNFHPIHIFLNTENLERYEKTRQLHQKPRELINFRHQGQGTRSVFMKLLGIDDLD